MKILIFANADIGLIKFRKELLIELTKEHEVTAVLPKGDFYREVLDTGCKFINVELDRHGINPFKEILLYKKYNEVVKALKPDIVFTYTVKPNIYGGLVCARHNIPYIANITGLGTAVENGGIMQKAVLLLYKLGLRKAQTVFFQNTENLDFFLKKGIVKDRYDLLPGSGVNLEEYSLEAYPKNDTVDFLFAARIMKEKGIDQYLEAAKYIRKKYPETRFHICGFCEQAYEDELQRLNRDGTVIYHGLVKDMKPMYKAAACVIHPSYYPEGLSNVLLEAAATGRPLITTDRSGCREVIDNGINGYNVNEKDSSDLIKKTEMFLGLSSEQRETMGMCSRKKVEKDFDRNIVIKKYMAETAKCKNDKGVFN